jgi:hypothetical protein
MMARDDARDAKLREAKRRAGWTMPLEHYYPLGALAEAFPDRYGYVMARTAPSQGATEMARASTTKPLPYTVEPVTGGCHVIRPQFGAGIRFRERKG